MKVADVVVETLEHFGVKQIFGIPGDAINNIMESVRQHENIDFIQVKHEESGAFAAGAQAKLTGKLSACVGTSGPGALHLLNGLYDAAMDGAPVVAITGQVESQYVGSDYHQEVNLESLFKDVAVYSTRVSSAEQAVSAIIDACRVAQTKRGVSHITISSDIAGQTAKFDSSRLPSIMTGEELAPSDDAVDQLKQWIGESRKTALLVGRGCKDARSEVITFAEQIRAPIVRTLPAKDIIDETEALCVGGTGLLGDKAGVAAIDKCDLLIMLGTDFPYADFYPEHATIVQIDTKAHRLGRRHDISLGVQADVKAFIKRVSDNLEPHSDAEKFCRDILAIKAKELEKKRRDEEEKSQPLSPKYVMNQVARTADSDSVFVVDTGTIDVWAARHLPVQNQQRFTLSSNLGSMAYSLPGAIGAQLSYPNKQVYALTGDGGFAMLMPDLITAVRYELPIIVVIFNNQKLGFIELEQNAEGNPKSGTSITNPNFAAIAESCGASGYSVSTSDELHQILSTLTTTNKPVVIDVRVNPDELVMPPKIPVKDAINFGVAKIKEFMS
ncbi:MAG: pyruvate oxidase [Gammaproteobacteria bacterium]|nr:pyruvate oxidase [Gammaproteobacteria bacterium]